MPRRRKKRKLKSKTESKEKLSVLKIDEVDIPTEFPLETYSLKIMQNFLRAREDIIVLAYRVPIEHLAKEEIVNHYRSRAISALQSLGRQRGLTVSYQHIEFKCLPLGREALIKASAVIKDVTKIIGQSPPKRTDPMEWGIRENI